MEHISPEIVFYLHEMLIHDAKFFLKMRKFFAFGQELIRGESLRNASATTVIGKRFWRVETFPAEELKSPGEIDVFLIHKKIMI